MYTSNEKDSERPKFPDTFKLVPGAAAVFMVLKWKHDIETKYGPRTLAEIVKRDEEDKVYGFWWPRGLAQPPVMTPVWIQSHPAKKGVFSQYIPQDDAAMKELWKTGEAPKQTGPDAQSAHALAAAALKKLK